MKPRAGFLLPCLLFAQQAPPPLTVHSFVSEHIEISIPTGWVAIPRAELDAITATLQQAAPNAEPQRYQHGFQASASAEYPRVLVQIKDKGRWSDQVFREIPHTGLEGAEAAIGKLSYDPAQRLAWLRLQLEVEEGKTQQALSGLHPTETGSVQVHCWAPPGDFIPYASLCRQIVTSVRLGDAIRYRERTAWQTFLADYGSSAGGALGAIAAVLVIRRLRKREEPAASGSRGGKR